MDLFSADRVSKQYSNHKALDHVSISVPEGKIFGLLGPNGAGKTTLIRIINQIIAPDEGDLMFQGRKLGPNDISEIGYLPEERGLYKKMTVGEQAIYLSQLKGLSYRDAISKLNFWFEKFEIRSWWNRKVEELSKGMQQKVQFLITIIHEPILLIFDEPFSGFDPINATLLKDEIIAQKKKGATIILSTHNMASVEELCDDIALIDNSQVVLNGPVKEIKNKYKTNTFDIGFSSYNQPIAPLFPSNYLILHDFTDSDQRHIIVKLPSEVSSNDVIRLLLPHVTIYSVKECIPSMNDIFIQVVTKQAVSSINIC